MTEAAGKEMAPELHAWFEAWKSCTQFVLAQTSKQAITFEISSDSTAATDSDLWYTIAAGGAIRGEMTLRLGPESVTRLAQKFLGETEPSGGPTAEHKEALEELLRQITGRFATDLASSVGGEVQFQVSASTAPSWSSAATACLRTRDEAGAPVCFELQVSAALAAALKPRAQQPPIQPPSVESPAELSVGPPSNHYDRLRDVGLEVKLRFGSRRMLLRDVLSLSAGIVIELDTNLHTPVDLLLDGRVVAQGEVVVVDGKYGLRVTDVLTPGAAS